MDAIDALGLTLILAGAIISLSGIGAVIGVPMLVIGLGIVVLNQMVEGAINLALLARNRSSDDTTRVSSNPRSHANQTRETLFEGRQHTTVDSGEFVHYDFELQQPAILEYDINVLTDENVNCIVTTEDYRRDFARTTDIKYLDKASEFNTAGSHVTARLNPSRYSIIVDNTGRQIASGEKPADIELSYQVTT